MNDRFELMLYGEGSNGLISLSQYLQLKAENPLLWEADLESSSLLLEVQDQEYASDSYNMGCVDLMAEQFAAAAKRLREGRFALIRQGILYTPTGLYYLIEPTGDLACLSSFELGSYEQSHALQNHFPINISEQGLDVELYQYVSKNMGELTAQSPLWIGKQRLPFSYSKLLATLERGAILGKEIYSALGKAVTYPYY